MEDARASDENSIFETSHVLGTLLACSPLLAQSWERCAAADATAASGFLHGGSGTVYVAFSGVHAALSVGPAVAAAESGDVFAPIGLGGDAARPLFAPLVAGEPEETVAVQALALQCFLRLHSSPEFQMLLNQMRGKAVVFTGHSLGGAIAALAALHYLCCLSSSSTSAPAPPILCVTFGSPLVGNKALSRAVLREQWGGNFCHVVSQHDIVPRLLFCPLNTISPHTVIQLQLHQWSASNRHPAALTAVTMPTTETEQEALRQLIQTHTGTTAMEQKLPAPTAPMTQGSSPYRPFGTYVLCSSDGAVCVDNLTVAVQMLYATLMSWRAPITTPEVAHFCYSDLVLQMPQHLLLRHGLRVSDASAAASAYDTGISLALEASGIDIKATEAATARQWLKTSRRSGCSPWQNCASLSTKLGSITPRRAQIEWYKASFDDDTGYYDAFKQRRSPKKYSSANLNRMRLGLFWDTVLAMLESSQLPYDFHRRAKWVNAARFYQLLVEPLDIAEYHRSNLHKTRGAYIAHGRERRYEVFDRWWKDRWWKEMACTGDNAATTRRSKYAGLTQDPCFWARVEEAREWTECLRGERDMTATATATAKKIENLRKFEWYSKELVEKKEVSVDVIAPLSSYTLWVQEWSELKSRDEFKQLFQF